MKKLNITSLISKVVLLILSLYGIIMTNLSQLIKGDIGLNDLSKPLSEQVYMLLVVITISLILSILLYRKSKKKIILFSIFILSAWLLMMCIDLYIWTNYINDFDNFRTLYFPFFNLLNSSMHWRVSSLILIGIDTYHLVKYSKNI